MARHDRTDDGDPDRGTASDRDRRTASDRDRRRVGTGEWFAASTLRVVLAFLGLVVLLFGLSMAMGVDLIGAAVDVLSTEVGRWLLVALVGLVILVVAVRGFGLYYRE